MIRAAARAAWEAANDAVLISAKAALAAVLTDAVDVDELERVAVIKRSPLVTLVVFTDGDLHLGVTLRQGGSSEVHLVVASGDDWQQQGAPIRDLVDLGGRLPALPEEPEEPPAATWVQPTGAHNAYALGALVTHQGVVWRSKVAANVWPPADGTLWERV